MSEQPDYLITDQNRLLRGICYGLFFSAPVWGVILWVIFK
jgi:hypothetical protein